MALSGADTEDFNTKLAAALEAQMKERSEVFFERRKDKQQEKEKKKKRKKEKKKE